MSDFRKIDFSPPDISEEEIIELIDTLKSGWITTGPKTKKFEDEIAKYCNTSRAVALNSWTSAMEMTLRLLGIGEGDEVITSAYTYTASASVIHHVGARVVLVDVAKDSFHIDPSLVEQAITSKTKAIIPVDIGGVMCDYDEILNVVNRTKHLFSSKNEIQEAFGRVLILADAAHSFGSIYKGKVSGEVADFTSFSFHAVKNLTTAEGGAVTWKNIPGLDNDFLYQKFMHLSLHGQTKDAYTKSKLGAWEYDVVAPYYKCNMSDIMASIGLAQLNRYPQILKRRKEIIDKYDSLLDGLNVTPIRHFDSINLSCGHLYLLRLNGKDDKFRNELIMKMAENGVATNVHYKPLPLLTAYMNMGFDINDFPNSLEIYKNEITLPLYSLLKDEDIKYIVETLRENLVAD